jgi:NAD(P)H-dependent FMN reductase
MFVTYGFNSNGSRAAAHLQDICDALQIRVVTPYVLLSLLDDMNLTLFEPREFQSLLLNNAILELIDWSLLLKEKKALSNEKFFVTINKNKMV